MRRNFLIAALAASLVSLAACSAGSGSSLTPGTVTTQSGVQGGFTHYGR